MTANFYYVLHVLAGFMVVAFTFQACAAPDPARRRPTLIVSGILSLLMLVGGFGLLARQGHGWELWVLIKLGCWVGLSALVGFAFRKPGAALGLKLLAAAFAGLAIWAVYVRPVL